MSNPEDSVEFRNAKHKRRVIKSASTRFITFLDLYPAKKDMTELRERLIKYREILDSFNNVQDQIEAITGVLELEERQKFEDTYYQQLSRAQDILDSCSPATPSVQTDTFSSAAIAPSLTPPSSNLRLPTISLPEFSGKYEEWLLFADMFTSVIPTNVEITPVQKLHYLRSCLKGDAAQVIQSIESAPGNYQVAWQLLRERYDNRRVIIQTHLRSLMELPAINKESASHLRPLVDNALKHMRALELLKDPVDKSGSWLVHVLISKLDRMTIREFERSIQGTEMPTIDQLCDFLKTKCISLESTSVETENRGKIDQRAQTFGSRIPRSNNNRAQAYIVKEQSECSICKGSHELYKCKVYNEVGQREKHDMVMRSNVCFNCLRPGHRVIACKSKGCLKCGRKHHTTLHVNRAAQELPKNSPEENPSTSVEKSTAVMQIGASNQVLLSTAMIQIIDGHGKPQNCRVLLDCGAQSNFITTDTVKRLNLTTRAINLPVTGFAQSVTHLKRATEATIKSLDNKYSSKLVFLVTDNITGLIPEQSFSKKGLSIPPNIPLADPQFHRPGSIDALIGAEIYYSLLSVGQIRLKNNITLLHKTKLGWLLVGSIPKSIRTQSHCFTAIGSLDRRVRDFWELEEITSKKHLSAEERYCEEHFGKTTYRDVTGRYHTRLPFNEKLAELGESFEHARKRFQSLENKLSRDAKLREQYIDFLKEYEALEHMTNVTDCHNKNEGFYIPHHGIVTGNSVTTKLRVVFDASAKSDSGISLNDTLRVGAVIQDDLFSIITRFRLHSIVFIADIEKMYRQVNLHPDDANYQKILWRSDPRKPLQVYRLNTVTYGTASASFLATRALVQLAIDEENSFPLASEIVKRDFYVDDLLTGANTIERALQIRDELIALLKRGGFNLRKWASNESALLESLARHSADAHICLDTTNTLKTLGLHWHPKRDIIAYDVKDNSSRKEARYRLTKRMIMSRVASLFDPIGLLAPVIVRAKILLQRLWLENLDWDESVPLEIATAWTEYEKQLPALNNFSVPRNIVIRHAIDAQIHGFCDSSEAAYAACLYLRSRDSSGNVQISLICAKTRVAPIKKVSLPRLELCAAVLLTRLVKVTTQAFGKLLDWNQTYLWSDSTIALHWIRTSPHKLKTFVANRVAEIVDTTQYASWRHVSSQDNPADLASRGLAPKEFKDNNLWLAGPTWLLGDEDEWPKFVLPEIEIPDQRKIIALNVVSHLNALDKFSSINTMKRVVAYCYRFIENSLGKKIRGPLTTKELEHALHKIIGSAQRSEFEKERRSLLAGRDIDRKSKLLPLLPFIDSNGLIRVGGRIKNSSLSYSAKHPILLPNKHRITELIIRDTHLSQLHAGTQATMYAVRQTYWILNARNRVRKIIRQCIKCFRAAPGEVNYVMSDLPKDRVSYSRPFEVCGVDYCGPFFIKEKKFRNRNKIKSYVAIFICFSTKAVHIELVTDLTSEAFIAALRRFIARRGRVRIIYSDNATNFVGARNELKDIQNLLKSEQHNRSVDRYLIDRGMTWKFIPPRSPHFGGIWEAAVKSFKNHLKRVLGNTMMTFEEFNTVAIEIESVLNSRPLTPLSTDPNDLLALSPSHFLIGNSMCNSSVPEHDLSNVPANRLSNWQHTQKLKQEFWKRWHKEYLNELSQRSKWFSKNSENTRLGSLVLLKEDNLSPMHWALGRIIEIHPGPDGVVRVATVKTMDGVLKRSVKKLVPLPLQD